MWMDGKLIKVDKTDIWWGNNWNHGDVFKVNAADLKPGVHDIWIYGIEGCCDGAHNIKWTLKKA